MNRNRGQPDSMYGVTNANRQDNSPKAPVRYPAATLPAHIDLNAPVIHFGRKVPGSLTTKPVAFEREKASVKLSITPPSLDRQLRTIMIYDLPETLPDSLVEALLRATGHLSSWSRAKSASGKIWDFGLAEFADVGSLKTAINAFKCMELPGNAIIHVSVDEKTREYIARQERNKPVNTQLEESIAKEAYARRDDVLSRFLQSETSKDVQNNLTSNNSEHETLNGTITIDNTMSKEEILENVPPEDQEAVLKEIASFRDRSNRKEEDLQKILQEVEARRKRENREKGIHVTKNVNANSQMIIESKYSNVKVPNSDDEEVDDELNDEEIEYRNKERIKQQELMEFARQEQRWLGREKSRTAAFERELKRDEKEQKEIEEAKLAMLKHLENWDDDVEVRLEKEEYFRDFTSWLRKRTAFRSNEIRIDEEDKALEMREKSERHNKNSNYISERNSTPLENASSHITLTPIKLSLANAKKHSETQQPRKVVADAEGLLGDTNDDNDQRARRLIPLPVENEDLGNEAAKEMEIRKIADSIPSTHQELWEYTVKWDQLDDKMLNDHIHPYITKKVVDYLGVQEDELIDFIVNHIREKKGATYMLEELFMVMEDEAEPFLARLWRFLILELELKAKNLV